MEQSIIIAVSVILIGVGIIGSVLPMLPGPPLIFLGAFIYGWSTHFTVLTVWILAVLAVLMLLSQLLDYLASIIGARKFGASRWGVTGAFLGGIFGLFLGGIAGVIIGPFLGALLCELLYGRTAGDSIKIGIGTIVGFIGGTIGKLVIALTMTGIILAAAMF